MNLERSERRTLDSFEPWPKPHSTRLRSVFGIRTMCLSIHAELCIENRIFSTTHVESAPLCVSENYMFVPQNDPPRARPPSSRLGSKKLKHSSRDALRKSIALRACLRGCRDDTNSSHKICSHILGSLPDLVIEPPVGADRTRTFVNTCSI